MQTGVIDEPLGKDQEDKLGVQEYADALYQFITDAQTPMTIGVQGDWGSGKTSLMNQMWFKFDDKALTRLKTKQIWVNTWEHSLLKTSQQTLVSIISDIINTLADDLDTTKKEAIRKTASKVLQGAFRIGASMTVGVEGANVVKEFLGDGERDNSIAALRRSLNKLIEEISPDKYDRFVIYIDDLDRLEPANAVEILELLKNIFNIKNCVFVLAIDYNVVVKGLAKKFGTLTNENRWEYDAFFHKIIQLTFQMPISNYDIGHYLSSLLIDTGFVKNAELNQEHLSSLLQTTVGGNPRSIKRLVNNIALNKIFIEVKEKGRRDGRSSPRNEKEKLIKFLLVALNCIQINYPKIYDALAQNPDFTNWEESFADEFANDQVNGGDNENIERDLSNFKANNEEVTSWELALYRICHPEPRLRARFKDVSATLRLLQQVIDTQNLPEIMLNVIEQTKVTSTSLSNMVAQTKAYQQMSNLDTKLHQLESLELNPNAIKAICALLEPSVNAAKSNDEIFVSLKQNAAVIYKVDMDTRKKEQWLYLFNPGKKARGIRFNLKLRSGLVDELKADLEAHKIQIDTISKHTKEGHEGTEFMQSIATEVSQKQYIDIMAKLGDRIKRKIIGEWD